MLKKRQDLKRLLHSSFLTGWSDGGKTFRYAKELF